MNAPQLTAVRVPPEVADKQEKRRDVALILVFGGAVVMTIFAAICLWLLQDQPSYVFWMGLAAHAHIAIGVTGLLGLLVKRSVKISQGGLEIVDQRYEGRASDLVSRQAVDDAVDDVPAVKPGEEEDERTSIKS